MKNLFGIPLLIALLLTCQLVIAGDYKPPALVSGQVDPSMHLQQGSKQLVAEKINDVIFKASGFGNTFMVVTTQGNVIIDTSLAEMAPQHKKLLNTVSEGPIRSIILTHGHGDHTGGVELWREADTKVIAQQGMVEFLHYQKRLEGMFTRRNSAQFGFDLGTTEFQPTATVENFAANIYPNTLFDKKLNFTLGDTEFEVIHTPGETYDALTVWLPQYRAAFVGDLFYRSFPNIYTLRGTKPRWALDYIASLDKILALEPELLLPSHGEPIRGKAEIQATLTKYRDAIQYVHDKTVAGMNQGEDVYSLMRDIKLPKALDIGEGYGRVSWSVRGIYAGYMGWFDGKPVNMYSESAESVYRDLVLLSGGADAVVELALRVLKEGDAVKALRLADAALQAEPVNAGALHLRLQALTQLRDQSSNLNESGWLNAGVKQAQRALLALPSR